MDKDMMDDILAIAKESYNQECNRNNNLLTKSDYLMKYIAATFMFINAVCVFLVTNKLLPPVIICIYYLLVSIVLMMATWWAICAQNLQKLEFFPTGETVLDDIKKKYEDCKEEKTSLDIRIDLIKYYGKYVEAAIITNNRRACFLEKSYYAIMVGLVCITLGFFIFLILLA